MRLALPFLLLLSAPLTMGGCGDGDAGHTDAGNRIDPPDAAAAPRTDAAPASADANSSSADANTAAGPHHCFESCATGGCTPPATCSGQRCELPPAREQACIEAHDCIPFASSWYLGDACAAADGCSIIEACVLVDGAGVCVRKPTSPTTCSDRGLSEVEWPSIEGPLVTVCGRTNYDCEARLCVHGCNGDPDCTRTGLTVCDLATHRCHCQGGSCADSFRGAACLDGNTRCGCVTDDDCTQAGFDHCYGGECGCADANSCDGLLPGSAFVCEPD